jgi:hypothetical protein
MNRYRLLGSVALLAASVLWGAGVGAQTAPISPPSQKTVKSAKPAVKAAPVELAKEARALELLKAMSERLAAARSMSFTAVVTYEFPSQLGPALAYTTKSEVTVQRPDKLKVITLGDGPASEFYYDGKSMMALSPAENLVAVAAAPATIDGALKAAYDTAAIYYPFTDLIIADPYAAVADGLKLAFYIGQSKVVGGTVTEMVAIANDNVFVQIWIGTEDKLPRMMRAVFRDDPLRLRHQMELSNWQLGVAAAPEAFASAKAATATRIAFAVPKVPTTPPGVKPAAANKPTARPATKSQ